MSLVLVAGTDSWGNDGELDWYCPEHAFAKFLEESGVTPLFDGKLPFIWSTDLDGIPLERKNHIDWAAGGAALSYFTRMDGNSGPVDLLVHSHGLQVALYAAAGFGVKIRNLVSVGSPVREDMEPVAKAARLHIGQWLHIHSDHSDRWQIFGEFFDGHLGIVREHPLADRNDFVTRVGHSELLRDKTKYHIWKDKGWLDFLSGQPLPKDK